MTKRLASKYKIDRRLGVNLWGRDKSPINRREYGPGQHGQRRRKPTGYAVQLIAKQKLKGYYGNIVERQFRRTYQQAVRMKGDTSENLIGLLEQRLDCLVYRLKLAPTVFAARQIVNHGHICVGGKRLNIPSARIKPGEVISVAEKSKNLAVITESTQSTERDIPQYITVVKDGLSGSLVRIPTLEEIPYGTMMAPNLVVEYYSLS
ncbi:MAG: 30S ribosomal protein S4 [Pseudomonadota bacterium]